MKKVIGILLLIVILVGLAFIFFFLSYTESSIEPISSDEESDIAVVSQDSSQISTGTNGVTITDITPPTGENTGNVGAEITGTNFKQGIKVELTRTGMSNPVRGKDVMVVDGGTRISCSFNLTNRIVSPWNLTVTNKDGSYATMNNAFIITSVSPKIYSITPSHGSNTSSINISEISGANFRSELMVQLTRPEMKTPINGYNIKILNNGTKITCSFDLSKRWSCPWNLTVTNSDGSYATLVNGFQITP